MREQFRMTMFRVSLCGLALFCAPLARSSDLSHLKKRDQVPAVCGPNWGYHQTCWRRFSPMPPCCSLSGCDDCLNASQAPMASAWFQSDGSLQPQQMSNDLPLPPTASGPYPQSHQPAEERPVSIFPERYRAPASQGTQPSHQLQNSVPAPAPSPVQPGNLPQLPGPLPQNETSQQWNPGNARPTNSSQVPVAPQMLNRYPHASGRYSAIRNAPSATAQFLEANSSASVRTVSGRYGQTQQVNVQRAAIPPQRQPQQLRRPASTSSRVIRPISGRYQSANR